MHLKSLVVLVRVVLLETAEWRIGHAICYARIDDRISSNVVENSVMSKHSKHTWVVDVIEDGSASIEVDGGINRDTIGEVWRAGADTFVAGNAVFAAKDPSAEMKALRAKCAVAV